MFQKAFSVCSWQWKWKDEYFALEKNSSEITKENVSCGHICDGYAWQKPCHWSQPGHQCYKERASKVAPELPPLHSACWWTPLQWCSPACRVKGWQLRRNFACSFFVALMTRLASMTRFLPSISITDVATAHIFFRDFWTILLESKIFILPLSLSAANWESFLKHWRAFEVSLSLFWNNSNVFS